MEQLDWPVEGAPTGQLLSVENDPNVRLVAALARATIQRDFVVLLPATALTRR